MTEDEITGYTGALREFEEEAAETARVARTLRNKSREYWRRSEVHKKRAKHLQKMAKDTYRLMNPKRTWFSTLKQRWDTWNENRKNNDGYPGI